MENLKLILRLFHSPASAMSDLIDNGSWLTAAILVVIVAGAFYLTVNSTLHETYRIPTVNEFYFVDYESDNRAAVEQAYRKATEAYDKALREKSQIPVVGDRFFKFFSFEPTGFFQPLIGLSLFYVPFVILLMSIFGRMGSFGILVRRDYGALAVCALSAWTAAHLPFAVAGAVLTITAIPVVPVFYFGMWAASALLFGVFMLFALRVVFGANYLVAAVIISGAWLSLSAGMYVFLVVSPWLFSPVLLLFGLMYFGGALSGEARGLGGALRQRQDFKRFLNNATVNPRDADAHVQLALIYIHRRQEAKALEHLGKAIAIDPDEIDANYELGKLARRNGDFQKAIDHFSVVLDQNDKFALSEIWREVGATYFEAGMVAEAREALEKFVERRPVDSEGLYYLGKILQKQNENEKAREMFEEAVQSAKSSPDYRRRELREWSKLAEKELGK